MSGFVPRTYWVDDPIDNFRLRVTLFHDAPPRADPPSSSASARAGATANEEAEALLPSSRRARRAQRSRAADGPSEGAASAVDGSPSRPPAALALPLTPSVEKGTRLNPYVREFAWQEKVLGLSEVRRYRRKGAPRTGMEGLGAGLSKVSQLFARADAETGFRDRSYADQIAELDARARADGHKQFDGEMLHSKVHVDRFVDVRELRSKVTTSELEKPSHLAAHVLSGRAYDGAVSAGARADAATDVASALGGLVVKPPPSQVMHIVAELGEPAAPRARASRAARAGADGGDGADDNDDDDDDLEHGPAAHLFVLCTIRAYGNGRLDMTPGFSEPVPGLAELPAGVDTAAKVELFDPAAPDATGVKWYKLVGSNSRVWRFRLDNLAERSVDEAERRAERAARMQELLARKHLGGVDFTPAPAPGGLNAHVFAELVGAHGFSSASGLLVQYFVHVNEGWGVPPDAPLHGMTHTCHAKWVPGEHGGEYAAHFGHPFELPFFKRTGGTPGSQGGAREGAAVSGAGDGSECGATGDASARAHDRASAAAVHGADGGGGGGGGAGMSASGFGSASMGTIFLQVMTQTRFNRFMVEGYGYVPLLPTPGMQTLHVGTWRPLSTISSHIRRFFVSEVRALPYVPLRIGGGPVACIVRWPGAQPRGADGALPCAKSGVEAGAASQREAARSRFVAAHAARAVRTGRRAPRTHRRNAALCSARRPCALRARSG